MTRVKNVTNQRRFSAVANGIKPQPQPIAVMPNEAVYHNRIVFTCVEYNYLQRFLLFNVVKQFERDKLEGFSNFSRAFPRFNTCRILLPHDCVLDFFIMFKTHK